MRRMNSYTPSADQPHFLSPTPGSLQQAVAQFCTDLSPVHGKLPTHALQVSKIAHHINKKTQNY